MRVEELKMSELVEFDSEGGLVRFANSAHFSSTQREGTCQGVVECLGAATARAVLTRYGYVQGWRLASATENLFQWESESDWQACALPCSRHVPHGFKDTRFPDKGRLTVVGSYEAEQYLAQQGKSDAPVCWTICGTMSGYLSRSMNRDIYVLEERCAGRGDSTCHFVAHGVGKRGPRNSASTTSRASRSGSNPRCTRLPSASKRPSARYGRESVCWRA
ncbi:MAG: XylR N-terminal domain-containing protein [bacterium]|nr:XylR N-terminal domain-containing protein [bacterium]